MKRVLFLCTGNSCRSQMAEAILNKIGEGRFQAVSAGSRPTGQVHPLAIRLLNELNFPTDHLRSKSWDEFQGHVFDAIITVCESAKESCPVWPGATTISWSFEDPAEAQGTDEEKMKVFRKVFKEIENHVQTLVKF